MEKEARIAPDLLLGRETREKYSLGFEVARIMGFERWRGFLTTVPAPTQYLGRG